MLGVREHDPGRGVVGGRGRWGTAPLAPRALARVVQAILIAWLVTVPATAVFAVVVLVPWRWLT